ncbi:hypothetical protein PRIPAC_86674 [Pristionchus pacificus]|uniref:Uncharacterized protein n=1 Tax=Pristionchus pacificus TaxID=54126 RepID=A0A2A6BGZ5_PRIPA|nr:hypothetical protein PRIPAC_86674 [Pristionchus pacificus]|eukprot:PDM65149.1 hypothetical protein PRIPAC_53398 [Pristionchus pacificus]
MDSVLDEVKSGLKDVGGQLIGNIAQSAEEKVDSRLSSMTETINNPSNSLQSLFKARTGTILPLISSLPITRPTCSFRLQIRNLCFLTLIFWVLIVLYFCYFIAFKHCLRSNFQKKMPTSSQTNDKIEVELFSLRKAVERDAEAITTELVSLVFFCKIAVVICCVLLGISVLKKLFLGSDSICGMCMATRQTIQDEIDRGKGKCGKKDTEIGD